MTQPLHGRRILVTGGATGIGAAAVHVLTEAGASIVATYHQTPPPERDGVAWVQCDVRDSVAVDEMVTGAAETLGGLDVLLHAAGLWQPGIPGQITGEDIDFLVDTNIKATIFANQSAYAVMRKDGDRLREFLGPAAAEFIDEQIKSTIPLGGALGDPVNDLGPTLVFLCSEGSRFITGQLIAVDGGLVMLGA
jgi:NAD(P)-dependent dehydrogenase (short-subunit alcohol dehydrogenase family)